MGIRLPGSSSELRLRGNAARRLRLPQQPLRDAQRSRSLQTPKNDAILTITPLATRLRQRIAEGGPIRFDAWMDACLYDEEGGFYARGATIGPRGAFATAPTLHPAFGDAIAAEVAGAARIIEVGPGDGTLAARLAATGAEILLVDRAAGMRAQQRERVVASLAEVETFAGAIVANELLDALAVRLVVDGREVFVDVEDGRFVQVSRETDLAAPSTKGRFALRPAMHRYLADLVRPLTSGRVVLVDYGNDGPGDGRREPIRTYIGGQPGGDPLQAPGTQDMTADVDFAQVRGVLADLGLVELWYGSQADFLRRHRIAPPASSARSDDDWRLARLMDDRLPFRVLVAALRRPVRMAAGR